MPRYLIACDFDGTITRRDTLHLIVDTYGDRSVWDALEPRLRAGEMSVEQAMEAEFATVRATFGQVRDLVRAEAGIREGFTRFVDWSRGRGYPFVVLSNGFGRLIADTLALQGLGDLPVHSHDAEFTPGGTRIVWTARGERCVLCDRPCKRHDLAGHLGAETSGRVVYLGDGVSDRCVALAADLIFARAGLAEYLDGIGHPYVPFEDFDEVREHLARLEPLAA